MSDEAPAKKADAGAPAWVMTFADLMSLLMCFFVLLLSFSEMDVAKYKQLAGSLKFAFGVQREIKAKEPPKGINVIAREFSPGRPDPTPLNVIRQMTTMENNINLDLGKERRKPVSSVKANSRQGVKSGDKGAGVAGGHSQTEGLTEVQKQALVEAKQQAAARLEKKIKDGEFSGSGTGGAGNEKAMEAKIRARQIVERRKRLEESARLISNALGREIKAGSVDVEIEDKKIIIRVREKASFGSGSTDLKRAFKPLLGKVAKILQGSEGKIRVAGHTDDLPIYTDRFRSNWELSSARAVSVVHQMMLASKIPAKRFLIEGYADTRPLVPNNSAKNRARNRRVEIILQQGEDIESPQKKVAAKSTAKARSVPKTKAVKKPSSRQAKAARPAAATGKKTGKSSKKAGKSLGIKAAGSR